MGRVLFAALLLSVVTVSGKERDWVDGKWTDAQTVQTGTIFAPIYGGGAVAIPTRATVYTVEADQFIVGGTSRKNIPAIINGRVKVCVEKSDMFVKVGEKEYKLKLVQVKLK
jgi:hypothetical protein